MKPVPVPLCGNQLLNQADVIWNSPYWGYEKRQEAPTGSSLWRDSRNGVAGDISYPMTENIARQHPATGLVKYSYERELGNVLRAQHSLRFGSANVNGC